MKLRIIVGTSLLCAMLASRAFADSIPPLPPPPDSNYGDFISDLTDTLYNDARRLNLVPGNSIETSFCYCANNIVHFVRILVKVAAGGQGINVLPISDDPSAWECKTSQDFNNLELGNEMSLNEIENLLQDKGPLPPLTPLSNSARPEKTGAANAAATLPRILPQLADVPFLPVYAASRYPNDVPCTASLVPDAYMVNHQSSTVSRFNPCSGLLVASTFVFSDPLQVAVKPDGSLALATSFDGALNFIDTSTNKATIVQTTNLSPSGVAISNDGTYAYVTSFDDANNFLAKVDLTQQKVVQTLKLPLQYPQAVNFNPEGSQAYVLFPFDLSIAVVDTLTMTVTRMINLPAPAFGVAFNSTGTMAFIGVRTNTNGTILVLNTSTYQPIKSIQVGDNPTDLSIVGNDQLLLSANFYGQSISIIDIASLQVLNTIPLTAKPHGLAQTQ